MDRKLMVQIPAFNEQDYIEEAINDIPGHIDGISSIDIIVINDGSVDNTLEIARQAGIKHIVDFRRNRGLGEAHKSGLAYANKMGADIVVNFDADLQYRGSEIPRIIGPILEGKANVVIGDRQLSRITSYPLYKLFTQRTGSFLVTILYHQPIKDVASGFRAYDKESVGILLENLRNQYTYTLESVCILAKKEMRIVFVPTNIRYPTRQSRLITSKIQYATNFFSTLIRCLFAGY